MQSLIIRLASHAVTLAAALAAATGGVALPAATAEAQDNGIDTIIVTARKREEELQDVPVAVTALTTEALLDRQVRDLNDIARFAPGLNFAKAFGRATERPVIRGLGNVLAGVQFGVESGTAYFVDGVYYPGDLQSLNIRDIERVEVIRGPQSALYARNTYAGAINFVTRAPSDATELESGLRFGEDGEMEFNAGVSGQLVDGGVLGGSLDARYYSFDGEYTNVVTGRKVGDEETRSVSGALDWTPTEGLRVRTRLTLQKDDDGTRAFFLQPSEMNNCYPGTRSNAAWTITGSTNNNQYYCGEINRPADYVALNDGPAVAGQPQVFPGVPDVNFPGNVVFGTPGGDPYNPQQGLVFSGVERDLAYGSLLVEYDLGPSGYTIVAAGSIRDEDRKTGSDSDHSPVNFLAGNPSPGTAECALCASERDDASDWSAELRLESPATERLRWMVGAFYYDQDIDGSDLTWSQPDGGPVNEVQKTENWAAFGSIAFDLTDTITATLEGRYFDEEKSLFQDATVSPASIPVFDESVDYNEFAPRATVDWNVTDDLLLYAIYAKGYKPGGLNGKAGLSATIPTPTYEQEESDNYELGVKSTWLDGRLTANLALFFIDVDQIQLTTPLSTGTGQLTSIVTNQGAGEVKGTELELRWVLTDSLSVGANYALADTEFTSGCDEFQWTLTSGGGLLTNFDSCTGNNAINGNGDGSIEGNQFPLSARSQMSAYADFRRPFRDDMEWFVNADVSWEDEKPVQVHNLAWVPDATLVNAQVGVDTGRVSFAVYGRNLTDEDAPAMVTRWLQDPLLITAAGFPSTAAAGAPPGSCPPNTCSTSYPRAFFGDMRRGRNFGVEFNVRFGGSE